MQRLLIAIGCNDYSFAPNLQGAERDAERLFDSLTDPQFGHYEKTNSRLLLSPTLSELREVLDAALFNLGKIDTFTFYFAGHGEARASSFFMWVKDTQSNRLAPTSFALTDLFMRINEIAPSQTNIVIDACFSGGLVGDLPSLLKPESAGNAGAPSVTLFAASARDKEALEQATGGLVTTSILDCIRGNTFIQNSSEFLELHEIGRKVSERLRDKTDQQPVLWTLNLQNSSIFCRNLHYRVAADPLLQKWSPSNFFDAIGPLLESPTKSAFHKLEDVSRLSAELVERAGRARDQYRKIEVRSAATSAMLEFWDKDPRVTDHLTMECLSISDEIEDASRKVCDAIRENEFALLNEHAGMADLFYLPVRLTRILGWAGAAFHIKNYFGMAATFDIEKFRTLFRLMIEHYAPSLCSMSDTQAPFVVSAIAAAKKLGITAEAEVVASCLFNSALEVGGNIADSHLPAEKVFPYLFMRRKNDFSNAPEFIARPSELLTAILKCARILDLEATFDCAMDILDHISINAYIPADYRHFSERKIAGGENATYHIGHDIWTVDDLEQAWPSQTLIAPDNPTLASTAILSSLLFPDRSPWFLFDREL